MPGIPEVRPVSQGGRAGSSKVACAAVAGLLVAGASAGFMHSRHAFLGSTKVVIDERL